MSPVRVKSFFTFKDKLSKMLLSGLVCKYECGGCSATCYGKTKHQFKIRICEYLGISHLTGKKVKIDNNKLTAIQGNLLVDPTLHSMKTHSVHLPPSCWGRVETPTRFSKRGAWQDLSFYRGVAVKEGVTFFRWFAIFT